MIKYKIISTNKKYNWAKTLTYFTTFYVIKKAYSEDRATEIGFDSAANITHISLSMSVGHASIKLNRGGAIGKPEYEATTAYHDYVKGLEESLPDAKKYAANISTSTNDQTITALCAELLAQLK